eukprot:721305-Amphidinium_carterae.1
MRSARTWLSLLAGADSTAVSHAALPACGGLGKPRPKGGNCAACQLASTQGCCDESQTSRDHLFNF